MSNPCWQVSHQARAKPCATSHHAGMVARYCYWIEQLAGIACSDRQQRRNRQRIPLPCFRAGPEIGVASTKAFTTQLAALFLLAVTLAKQTGRLTPELEAGHLAALRYLSVAVQKVLALELAIKLWSGRFADKHHALFLGRGPHFPIALEGALKLKEISCIHAEGYPADELNHGPLALVDQDMPVVRRGCAGVQTAIRAQPKIHASKGAGHCCWCLDCEGGMT